MTYVILISESSRKAAQDVINKTLKELIDDYCEVVDVNVWTEDKTVWACITYNDDMPE